MENITRLFNIKNGCCSGWSNSNRTSFILSVEWGTLEMKCIDGRTPLLEEFMEAVARLLLEYVKEYGPLPRYPRKNRYRFAFREGLSGCMDMYLEEDRRDGFPKRRLLFHVSCFGKVGDMKVFVYDVLDWLVAEGYLEVEDGVYIVPDDVEDCEGEVTVVKPRFTEYEEGWNDPDETPKKPVPLRVCREIPDEDESEPELDACKDENDGETAEE